MTTIEKFYEFIGIKVLQEEPINFKATTHISQFLCDMAVKQGYFVRLQHSIYALNK